jgi:hypothetical protein
MVFRPVVAEPAIRVFLSWIRQTQVYKSAASEHSPHFEDGWRILTMIVRLDGH